MAKLSASERKALPASTFGEPTKAGKPATAAKITAKVNTVMAKKSAGPALSEGFTPMGSAKSATKKRGY